MEISRKAKKIFIKLTIYKLSREEKPSGNSAAISYIKNIEI